MDGACSKLLDHSNNQRYGAFTILSTVVRSYESVVCKAKTLSVHWTMQHQHWFKLLIPSLSFLLKFTFMLILKSPRILLTNNWIRVASTLCNNGNILYCLFRIIFVYIFTHVSFCHICRQSATNQQAIFVEFSEEFLHLHSDINPIWLVFVE